VSIGNTLRSWRPEILAHHAESERDELRRLRREIIELQTDKAILSEGGGAFRPRADEMIRFRFLQDNQADLPLTADV
jgi:hypothetical protein